MRSNPCLKNLDSLIAALLGFLAIRIFTQYSGIGISPDSIMYESTAHNIANHGTLLTFINTPLVFFPVFYPFFLSIILFITRVNTFTAAPYINGILFALVIFTTGWLVSKFKSTSVFYKWLILIALVLSPALLEIYTYLWSETLFILVVLLFIVAYRQYQQKHTLNSLLAAAIITAIGCITRYAGVTIIGTGCLLLLFDNALPLKKRLIHLVAYGSISSSLLAGNLLLNKLSTGLGTGTREPSITPFSKNLYYFGTVTCDWIGLPQSAYTYAIALSTIIFILLITLFLWNVYKGRIKNVESTILAFAIVYGLFIVISSTFSRYERINSRLLSPMFITLLIGCTSWVSDVLKSITLPIKYIVASPLIALMLFFGYVALQTDLQRYDDQGDYGVPGYSDDDWNKSDFVVFLKNHKNIFKPGVPVYSDANEAVYLFSGMSSKLVPHRFFKNDVKQFFKIRHYYYIWFKKLDNTELINIHDIEKVENLHQLYNLKDGAVYEYNSDFK